jgi:signal transduction histidine kinase
MRVQRAPAALWSLAALGPLLLVASAVVTFAGGLPRHFEFTNVYPNLVFGTLLPAIGVLIVSRLPRHPIGWLFTACGLASAITVAVYTYAEYGLVVHPGSLPGALAAGWVSSWVWAFGFAPLVTFGVLLFPDGHLPSRRWRYLAWLDAAAIVALATSNAFRPGPLTNHPVADNPLGVPLPHQVFAALGAAGFGLLLVGLAGSAVSAVVRWRRADAVERAQLSWFAFAAVLLAVVVVAPMPNVVGLLLSVVAIPLLPMAVAVAILRRHLYGIEVVVRRSLVYGTLTVVLLTGYALTVVALGALLRGHADPAVALVATALVAVAFAPVRDRLQRAAGRLLYGDRDNPYAVLSGVSRRLDVSPQPDDGALAEIAETVATSLRLPYVRVDVCREGAVDGTMSATFGQPTDGVETIDLTFRGARVGRLFVAPQGPHEAFRAADRRLLDDLGRQIGVAAHAMLLTQDLQRSREGLVAAREEERRRIRRDLHDGLGPALAGVALGLDAAGRLVRDQPDQAAVLTGQLKDEVQASLADVRRLVEDLRPPALDQLGLVGAVRQQADRLSERDPGLEVAVDADRVPALPAAVEVAAYRISTEALNNVARHAAARHCRVGICVGAPGELLVEVEDDGVGLPQPVRPGVGMTAMRERALELGGSWETTGLPSGGTRVTARLPLVAS